MVRRAGGGGGAIGRFAIAAILVVISLGTYFCNTQQNPVTGEEQNVSMTPQDEVALGLQAAPTMVAQFGGPERNDEIQRLVDQVGAKLISASPELANSPWQWEFTVLDDDETINAFALPGGQLFVTDALLRIMDTEGELAGVLGHEIGHVVGRHGAQQMAKAQLTQGLTGAAVLATYDPEDPSSRGSAAVIALMGQLVNMKFGREDELESDEYGVEYMAKAGYDPRSMITVMEKLAQSNEGNSPPEFFSTHPNPENRVQRIQEAIDEVYPNGVPDGLTR